MSQQEIAGIAIMLAFALLVLVPICGALLVQVKPFKRVASLASQISTWSKAISLNKPTWWKKAAGQANPTRLNNSWGVNINRFWNSFITETKGLMQGADGKVGFYFGPITWYFFRVFACAVAGTILFLLIILVDWLLDLEVGYSTAALLSLLLAAWLYQPKQDDDGNSLETENIPTNYAALLTLFGKLILIYRVEGDYSWTGEKVFLGRSKVVRKPGTNEQGYLYMGSVVIQIWNEADQKNFLTMKNTAKNDADITGTLTVVGMIKDGRKWIRSLDPILDLADRARSSYRAAMAFFNDTDNIAIKHVLRELLDGATVLGCFIRKNVEQYAIGSLVRDGADIPMTAVVHDTNDLEQATTDLQNRIANLGTEKMCNQAKGRDDNLTITPVHIGDTMEEVASDVGFEVTRFTLGDVTASKVVSDAANASSSEGHQLAAQERSAEAQLRVRTRLKVPQEDADDPLLETNALIAAAQDNRDGVRLIHVTGSGGEFVKAASVVQSKNP